MNKIAIFLLLFIASFNVLSQNVSEQIKKCAVEQSASKRLACFDAINQNLTPQPQSQPPATQVVTSSEDTPTPKKSIDITKAAQEFGLEHKLKNKELADNIVANVLSIKKDPYKKYIITLDNNHVWKQSDSTRLKISVGDTVIVKRGALSSFFMAKEGKNKRLRVKRLK
jgi:hypothetical protein